MNRKLLTLCLWGNAVLLATDLVALAVESPKDTAVRLAWISMTAFLTGLLWMLRRNFDARDRDRNRASTTITTQDPLPKGSLVLVEDSIGGKEQFYVSAPPEGTGPYTHRVRKHL